MELLIFTCALVLFCAIIMVVSTAAKWPYEGNRPGQNPDKQAQNQAVHLINITDDLRENGPIGIIVYRVKQPTGFDIYNKRGEIIKNKFPPDTGL